MPLGERIRRLRTARGWSSGELSKNSGVSRAYLWQLETGGRERPSFEVLEKLARVLGVSVSEFSDGQRETESDACLPPGLRRLIRTKRKELDITESDIEVMKGIHFRGEQPSCPEDWELLFLFLKKWAQ